MLSRRRNLERKKDQSRQRMADPPPAPLSLRSNAVLVACGTTGQKSQQ